MIVVVMGMSKSGTTLISKTLHESGIDMNPGITGNYNKSKYEDHEAIEILKQMIGVNTLQSLYLPENIIFNKKIESEIINYISNKKGSWGFKQPYLTLCYYIWKKYLPPHIAIGVKRSYEGLKSHWTKRHKVIDNVKLKTVQDHYNKLMKSYKIPIVEFEDLLIKGPHEVLKNIVVGIKLKDVREVK